MSSVYEERGGVLYATELARGPWDPDAQHGGAPAAVLMRAFERVPAAEGLMVGRMTLELLRPVPLGELLVSAGVAREGRRVQLLEGTVCRPDGVEVVRARALRVARSPVSPDVAAAGAAAAERGENAPPAGPQDGEPSVFRAGSDGPMFPTDAMEIRFVRGRFLEQGPATAWFRLRVPIVAGEEPSGMQRLAAASDFPNGIATELDWDRWLFINPDLTIHVFREPVGEWICLDARMRVAENGVGLSEAVLYDSEGRVGRSLQTLYIAPRA